jgi:hypothetical protein
MAGLTGRESSDRCCIIRPYWSAAWEQAQAREIKLTSLPSEAKDGMKAGICTLAARAELERKLAD